MVRIATSAVVASVGLLAVACSADDAGSGGTRDGEAATTTTVDTDDARMPTVTSAPHRSEVYADEANWLCLPGRLGDACDVDLDVTLVEADGSTEVQPHEPAADPPLDCFYVYPTISGDPPPNADLAAGPEERGVVALQFARLSSVCRPFAPVYRQVPLAGLSSLSGVTTTTQPGAAEPREVAYGDVLDAWRHYLAQLNPDAEGGVRPFVLVGHSQGSGHLTRLIAEELDGDGPDAEALRSRLAGALLIGSGVPAPGSPGAFEHVPPCASPDDRRCVVSYASFAAAEPPPPDSLFGAPRTGEGRVLCTNPAAPGGGPAPLDTIAAAAPGTPGVTTPWVRYRGLVAGECVREGRFDYLRVTPTPQEGDARPADLGGRITPQWGLHLIDVNLAQGDLVDLVRRWSDSLP